MAVVPNGTSVESAPLSAPKSHDQTHTLSVVILIVAMFSALGAMWMILGFVVCGLPYAREYSANHSNHWTDEQIVANIQTPTYPVSNTLRHI